MDIDPNALRAIIFILLVASIALHEWGHAAMADRLGDDTPRSEGRVTLNPIAHIDAIGTIILPLMNLFGMFGGFAMIGWGKPVYTNPSNFRRGYFDQALVTLAGPGMNLVLAIAATFAAALAHRLGSDFEAVCLLALQLNVTLIVFNMLPVPPLDGSKFLMYWGAMKEETYFRVSMFGGLILLVLINLPFFRGVMGRLIGFAMKPFELLYVVLT